MQVKTLNGVDVEITSDEAKRIADTVLKQSHESKAEVVQGVEGVEEDFMWKNNRFTEDAKRNIRSLADLDDAPETEVELKKILYKHLPNITDEQADLLYEVMECMVGMHTKKIFS